MFKQSFCLVRNRSGLLMRRLIVSEPRCVSWIHLFAEQKPASVKLLKIAPFFAQNSRSFAKGRDIRKEKKKKTKIDENELQEYFDVEKLQEDMGKPLEIFKEDLFKFASVRSSLGQIKNIRINYEGSQCTIQDLAEMGKKSARLVVLDFSAFPSAAIIVMAALKNSEINFNPQQDGTRIFLQLPKVTREQREVLAKKCKIYFFKCKDAIRDVQMSYVKSLSSIDKLSSDMKFKLTSQLTTLGDQKILLAEEILKAKCEEILKEEEVV